MNISDYPTEPLSYTPIIDVIIPYNRSDRHLVREAVTSIILQEHVTTIIHMVADACDQYFINKPKPASYPATHYESYENSTIYHYKTHTNLGPYNIVNSLVPHLTCSLLAIQDADDISSPQRLWKQAAQLQTHEMTSCAMLQQAIEGYDGTRHIREPVIYPGSRLPACPMGRSINSTRMMHKEFFVEMNGFKNMPCSGDFQFDNRCLIMEPPARVHGSEEILAIRRLRPMSLSNGGPLQFGSELRNQVAWTLGEDVTALRKNPTKEHAQALGSLHSQGNVALSQPVFVQPTVSQQTAPDAIQATPAP